METFQTTTWTEAEFSLIEFFVHGDAAYAISEWSDMFQMEGQEPEGVNWYCFSRFKKEDGVWRDDRDICGPRDAPPEG